MLLPHAQYSMLKTAECFACAATVTNNYCIYLNVRCGFSLKFDAVYEVLKFAYEVLNQMALNQTTQSQTKTRIAKSCEISVLCWDILQHRMVIRNLCCGTT